MHGTACYTAKDTYNCGSRTYQYRSMFRVTIMVIYINQDQIPEKGIETTQTPSGSLIFCAVHDIVLFNNSIWVLGFAMSHNDEYYTANTVGVKIIRLVDGVSRVAAVQKCISECGSSPTQHVVFNRGMFSGVICKIHTRKHGYPSNLG